MKHQILFLLLPIWAFSNESEISSSKFNIHDHVKVTFKFYKASELPKVVNDESITSNDGAYGDKNHIYLLATCKVIDEIGDRGLDFKVKLKDWPIAGLESPTVHFGVVTKNSEELTIFKIKSSDSPLLKVEWDFLKSNINFEYIFFDVEILGDGQVPDNSSNSDSGNQRQYVDDNECKSAAHLLHPMQSLVPDHFDEIEMQIDSQIKKVRYKSLSKDKWIEVQALVKSQWLNKKYLVSASWNLNSHSFGIGTAELNLNGLKFEVDISINSFNPQTNFDVLEDKLSYLLTGTIDHIDFKVENESGIPIYNVIVSLSNASVREGSQ